MRIKIRLAMISILCLMAGKAEAQFLQYTPPGGPEVPPESRKEELEREIEAADYHLGAVRIGPWAAVRNAAYVKNVFSTRDETPNDFTATAGAGFRAYLRNGPKAAWRLQVLPELTWWARQSERRQLNGRYTLGFHGFFNRLTLEVQGGREQQQQIITPEVPVLTSARRDGGELLAEVEVSHALFAFAATSLTRQDSVVEATGDARIDQLSLLDREDRSARVGLRWRPRQRWMASLGAERSRTDFDPGTRGLLDRSNAGTAPVAELRFNGRRLRFAVDLAARSLEARQGSDFVPYDKVTGSAAVTLRSASRLSGTFYTSRNLLYALSEEYAYLTDQRLGLALDAEVGARTQAHLFAETGGNDYTAFRALAPRRQEDTFSYGASVTFQLARRVSLGLQALHLELDSNLPGSDRSYSTVGTTLNLVGALGRL